MLGALLDVLPGALVGALAQIGITPARVAPVSCVLKFTMPQARKHPFGDPAQLAELWNVCPSVVAADVHSASVPTETEPAGHTFVPGVPVENAATTN